MITLWVGQLQFALGPYIQNLADLDSVTASQWTGTVLMAASPSVLGVGVAVCLITAGLTLAAPWYGSSTLVGGLMLELVPDQAMAATCWGRWREHWRSSIT